MSQINISNYRNALEGHVLLAPSVPESLIHPGYSGAMEQQWFVRRVFLPGQYEDKAFSVCVEALPKYLQGRDFALLDYDERGPQSSLVSVYASRMWPVSTSIPAGTPQDTGFIAQVVAHGYVVGVAGFGSTVMEAVMDAGQAAKHVYSDFYSVSEAAMQQRFEQAQTELLSATRENRRRFVTTAFSHRHMFSQAVPIPCNHVAVVLREDGEFEDSGETEPYSYEGTFRHQQVIVNTKPFVAEQFRWWDDNLRCVLDYSTDKAQWFVVYHDNGPRDDYYSGHDNWMHVVAAFDSQTQAQAFLDFRNRYYPVLGHEVIGL